MPIVESVSANLDGSGQNYLVQGWDDGGTTVVRNGQYFMKTKGSVPITGTFNWNRNPHDTFLAVDIDHDGKQEILIANNDDGWTGILKWQGAPAQLHTIWGSPSPVTGVGGTWVRRAGDTFSVITADGGPAAEVTAIGGALGILQWVANGLSLTKLVRPWPLGFHQEDTLTGGTDVVMTTDVTIFQNGKMHVNTHVHEYTDLHGAHVAVVIVIYGPGGEQIQYFPAQNEAPMRYGVDGSLIGNSEAYGSREFTVASEVLSELGRGWLAIKQYPSPNNWWQDVQPWIEGVGKLASTAGNVAQAVNGGGGAGGGGGA